MMLDLYRQGCSLDKNGILIPVFSLFVLNADAYLLILDDFGIMKLEAEGNLKISWDSLSNGMLGKFTAMTHQSFASGLFDYVLNNVTIMNALASLIFGTSIGLDWLGNGSRQFRNGFIYFVN